VRGGSSAAAAARRARRARALTPPPPPPPEWGNLKYELSVDARLVLPCAAEAAPAGGGGGAAAASPARAGATVWVFSLGARRHVVEYDHRSLDILLNSVRVEAEAGFADAGEDAGGGGTGTRHVFSIPPTMEEAVLAVEPPAGGRGAPRATLVVAGVERPPE